MDPIIVIAGLAVSALILALGGYRLARLLRLRRRCTGRAKGYVTERVRLGSGDDELHCFDVVYTAKGAGYTLTQTSSLSPGNRGRTFEVRYDPHDPACAWLPEVENWFVPIALLLAGLAWPVALLVLRCLGYL